MPRPWRPNRNDIASIALAIAATLAATPAAGETVYVIDKLLVGVHAEKTLDSTIIKAFPTGTSLEVLKRDGDMAMIKGPGGVTGWVDAVYLTKEQPAAQLLPKLEEQNRKLADELKAAQSKVDAANAELESVRKAAETSTTVDDNASDDALAQLETETDNLRRALDTERMRNNTLQSQVDELKNQTPADAQALADLTQENAALKQDLEEAQIKAIRAAEAAPQAAAFGAANLSRSLPLPIGVIAFIGLALLLSSFMAGIWFMDARQRRRLGGMRL
jgi:SH3 domain protein